MTPGHVHPEETISKWLQIHLRLPPNFAHKLFANGWVKIAGKVVHADHPVPAGAKIWLACPLPKENGASHDPAGATIGLTGSAAGFGSGKTGSVFDELGVLYEDPHVLVVDKPAGLLVHSDGTGIQDTLDNRVLRHFAWFGEPGEALHVHRLDRDTTGCVLFAKHVYAQRALDTMMTDRLIHRTYLAVTTGLIPKQHGTIDTPIGRDRHRSGLYRVSATGKPAVTLYERLQVSPQMRLSAVSCQLETGRTHQIRVHLSSVGCPIVNDVPYGGGSVGPGWKWQGSGHALHAWKLSFYHPYTDEMIEVEAPVPSPLRQLMATTGWSPSG